MIKVLIERIIAEGLEAPYEAAARSILQQAIQSPGYLFGESFIDLERPNQRYVIVTWQNRHSWERWEHSPERKECLDLFAPMLMEEEKVTLLEPL
ncbi:antibiotic biosynthesis monooxygenase family protein [Pseudomonas sp. FME51]|uniref:antibiotic biosynthesis monooxygenase family protein n=1 Tax=Pseudomonas sp. FME51 TaxID=2742609 RepID=UPI0018671191|nr:antibiotic biosynthesis monooxygenase [Pseudomonas sp. FME51]